MSRLRALAENHLSVTLEGDWSDEIRLTAPDGVRYTTRPDGEPLRGQVLRDIVRRDVETGERLTIATPVITLRRSSLTRIPAPGEIWMVESDALPAPGQYIISPSRPPEGGGSIGFIRLYLQLVEDDA